eukprot:scaffold2534_cov260-Pinguiococcus_pyrenoidosus.AAC.20
MRKPRIRRCLWSSSACSARSWNVGSPSLSTALYSMVSMRMPTRPRFPRLTPKTSCEISMSRSSMMTLCAMACAELDDSQWLP